MGELGEIGACSEEGEGGDVDPREVNFLVLHALINGPCKRSATLLMDEMQEKEMLPLQYDWMGKQHHPTYEYLVQKYKHITPDYLMSVLSRAMPRIPLPVDTILAGGDFLSTKAKRQRASKRVFDRSRRPRNCLELVERRCFSSRSFAPESYPAEGIYQNFRRIKTVKGHSAPVFCVVHDRESRYIITGSDDRLVKIWSAEVGYLRHSLRGHEKDVTDLAVHPENTMIVSASNDGTLRAWDMRTGIPIAVLTGHTKEVHTVVFSPCPDRPYVLSGGADGTCRLWNSDDFSIGCVTIELPLNKSNRSIDRTPTVPGNHFASGSYASIPRLETNTLDSNANAAHSTVSGSPMMSIEVLCVSFNSAGTRFVVGGTDCAAHVFQVLPRRPPRKPQVKHLSSLRGHTAFLYQVLFSRLGDRICTGCRDGTARIWRREKYVNRTSVRAVGRPKRVPSTWTSIVLNMKPTTSSANSAPAGNSSSFIRARRQLGYTEVAVDALQWSLDDTKVITSSSDNKIRVWDSFTGALLNTLDMHENEIFVLDAHPFDRRILLSGSYDGRCALWDIDRGKKLCVFEPPTEQHRDGFNRHMLVDDTEQPRDGFSRHMIVDGCWSPNGLSFTVADMKGGISMYAMGESDFMALAPTYQFFALDHAPLTRDQFGNVVDEETGLPPHMLSPGPLCDSDLIPHPPELQPEDLRGKSYNMESNSRIASSIRVQLNARAEEYRRREVEEENRLAREAYLYSRERAQMEAIRVTRREWEMTEAGTTSGNGQSRGPPESVQRFIEALDRFDASDDSDSEPDDPEWEVPNEMRITRATARAATMENETGDDGNDGHRLRRVRAHPARTQTSGDEAASRNLNGFATENELHFSNESQQINNTGESLDHRSARRLRQMSHQRRAVLDVASNSPSMQRSVRVNTIAPTPTHNFVSQGRRVEQTSTSIFPRDDQGSVAATESIGMSEVAEARTGPVTMEGDEAFDHQQPRRTFSTRSPADSPTNANLQDEPPKKRKRQRRTVDNDGDESPKTSGIAPADGRNQGSEIVRMPSLTTRSKQRYGCSSRTVDDSERIVLGTEIGSWRMQPADCIEQKRNTVPDPVLDGDRIPISASAWLHATVAKDNEYVPQVNDKVVYFPQGHQRLIEAEVENGIWSPDAADTSIPFSPDGKPQLFQIVRVEYRIPHCIYIAAREKRKDLWQNVRNIAGLHLKPLDENGDLIEGKQELYTLSYYPVDSVPEYMVLQSRVQNAKQKKWHIGEKFKMLFMDEHKKHVHYRGHVSCISPDIDKRPWNSIEVVWESEEDPDRGASMWVNPWELEPIHSDGKQTTLITDEVRKVQSLSDELVKTVRHELQTSPHVQSLAAPFMIPIRELTNKTDYTNFVPCPLTLDIWLNRLQAHFYRHEASILADLSLLRSNAIAYSAHDAEGARQVKELSAWLLQAIESLQSREIRPANNDGDGDATKSAEAAGGYNATMSTNNRSGKQETLPSWQPSPHNTQSSVVALPPPEEIPQAQQQEHSAISGAAAESTISYGGAKTTNGSAMESGDDEVWPFRHTTTTDTH